MNVRKAKPDDIEWLLKQLRCFADFYGTKHTLFSKDDGQNRRVLRSMIDSDVFLVCDEGDENIGFVAGFLVPHAFNPTLRLLSETFWWVCEGRRGSRAARLLLDEFIKVGKKQADWIDFAIVVGKTNVNDRAFLRRGFRLMEKRFLMEA
jgi:hypothetical protein